MGRTSGQGGDSDRAGSSGFKIRAAGGPRGARVCCFERGGQAWAGTRGKPLTCSLKPWVSRGSHLRGEMPLRSEAGGSLSTAFRSSSPCDSLPGWTWAWLGKGRHSLGLQEGDRLISGHLTCSPGWPAVSPTKGTVGPALPQSPPAGVHQAGPGSLTKESVWVNKSLHRFVLLSSPSPLNTQRPCSPGSLGQQC